jgi:hypothetical protein
MLPAAGGRVAVYRPGGSLFTLVAESPELHFVEDVAAGDVDGDGHEEILAVGGGRLTVLRLDGRAIRVVGTVRLGSDWTHRVAAGDLDGDGRDEAVAALYDIHGDAEVGRTVLLVLGWEDGALRPRQEMVVEGHVGDLAAGELDGLPGAELLLERGYGDEGGVGLLLAIRSGREVVLWEGTMTSEGRRALQIARSGSTTAVAATDGTVRRYSFSGGAPAISGSWRTEGGMTGMAMGEGMGVVVAGGDRRGWSLRRIADLEW